MKSNLKHLNVNDLMQAGEFNPNLAIAVCGDYLIVTESDFIHYTTDDREITITITGISGNHFTGRDITLTKDEIVSRLGNEVDLPLYGHYWGIKDRVGRNYHLLRQSMREIGLDTSDMPDFWK